MASRRRCQSGTAAVALIVLAALAASCSSSGSSSSGSLPRVSTNLSPIVEQRLGQDPSSLTEGEPEIAQDPRDPSVLYYDWTSMNYPPTKLNPIKQPCGGLMSSDGGTTWTTAYLPMPSSAASPCSDAVAAYGPDGTLYAGGIVIASYKITSCSTPGISKFGSYCLLLNGYDGILRSADNGRTWSAAVATMGSATAGSFHFAPGSGNPVATFDRPWLAVDQSNGAVYAIGHNLSNHEGFVTASTNKASSFGTIYAIDSPSYPQGGMFGGDIAAAKGVLAVAYPAASAPGGTCPCVVFETSTDHGATWSRHVLHDNNVSAQPFPYVTADPNAKGHFALTVLDSSGTENQVYVTDDSGKTWQGPTNVGESPANQRFKPWIAYGPSGQLALVWRTWHGAADRSAYDVWAAIGKEQGSKGMVFSAPLRVSDSPAPYPPGYGAGDDFSFVIMDHHYVHVGWGDSKNGPPQSYYSRIPISDFKTA